MDFIGKEIEKASNLTLVGVNGTDLQTFNITKGSYKNSYFVTFVPSPEKFRLKVTGTDKTGARFQRVKPTLFTLGDVKLSQNVDGRNSSAHTGKSSRISWRREATLGLHATNSAP